MSADQSLGPVVKEGWSTKQGGRIKTWKKRWFVLRGTWLIYYTKPGGVEKGRINIASAKAVAKAPECRRQPAYKIEIPTVRTYYVVSPTPRDVDDWIETLEGVRTVKPANHTSKAISAEDFETIRTIGRGTYGTVQLVRSRKDGQLYAMKVMSKRLLAEYEQVEQTLTEKAVLIETRHPFLVGAHFTFQTDSQVYLVLDYVPGGELFSRLKEEHQFSERRTKLYAAEILLGLGHLHSKGFVYRDLKPENILVDRDGHLKLTDFGLVKPKMGEGSTTTTTFCGTPEYIAPEMLQQKPYTKAVDWWSFGILVYEMLCGLPPFYDENTNRMYRAILHDEVTFPDWTSPLAQDLILKLLERNPRERMGSGDEDYREIQSHLFFTEIEWEDVLRKRVMPEWVPKIKDATDTSNFDAEFTQEEVKQPVEEEPVSGTVQSAFDKFTYVQGGGLD